MPTSVIDPVLVGIDVGGTFTDFVIWRAGQLSIHKTPTTPDDQSRAIVQGLQELGLLTSAEGTTNHAPRVTHHLSTITEFSPDSSPLLIVHGMTVATNALLERRGARTALLTTAGFRDVLVIGRQNRPHLYRLSQGRPPALVTDALRLEVTERLDANGQVVSPLDDGALAALADQLAAHGAESLAIVFLFSFRNPSHEQRAAAALQARLPTLPISLSSAILPEYREYERTATTVINAYVQPLVSRYLANLAAALGGAVEIAGDASPATGHESTVAQHAALSTPHAPRASSIHIMQSNGGVIGLAQAAAQAARVVLSGPAGGVVGAFAVAQQALASVASPLPGTRGPRNHTAAAAARIVTFDMGGTSTDVCLCPGRIPVTAESTISDLPLRLPIIDIHTVGAGGGSIAFVDAGGALQVGPQSAGAMPGPAAYGHGGLDATVTDANLVLGRLDPAGFLDGKGRVQLDGAAAHDVLAELGTKLGVSAQAAALGVVQVANATMERALRKVSVEQGYDPRAFTLLPFGGAGPLHACDLADALGMRRILCPPIPGVLSAYGMLVADVVSDSSQSVLSAVDVLIDDWQPLQATCTQLATRAVVALGEERRAAARLTAAIDLRYRGQSYELTVPLALPIDATALRSAVAAFHESHEQRYGYAMPEEAVEAVTIRVRANAPGAQLRLPTQPLAGADPSAARLADRRVWFSSQQPQQTAIFQRSHLEAGNQFAGPAIVLQYDSTILVSPGWQAWVDTLGNLWLTR